jgi:hypothetical protein
MRRPAVRPGEAKTRRDARRGSPAGPESVAPRPCLLTLKVLFANSFPARRARDGDYFASASATETAAAPAAQTPDAPTTEPATPDAETADAATPDAAAPQLDELST